MPEAEGDEGTESQETTDDASEATATQPDELTTLRKRLSGKDQALTATQKERDALRKQAADLEKWKAEREQADMTEVERLQQERDALRAERDAARAQAQAVGLSKQYPLAADLLGDDLTKFDEARVAEINGRLKSEEEGNESVVIDPNNARRNPPTGKPASEKTSADLEAELAGMGNPYK